MVFLLSCEDPNCADQWALRQTNIDDHLVYLGLPVNCNAVSGTATTASDADSDSSSKKDKKEKKDKKDKK